MPGDEQSSFCGVLRGSKKLFEEALDSQKNRKMEIKS